MIDLSTNYLGLKLKSPLAVSSTPLSESVDNIRRMEDAGAAAVVLTSLFEEQLALEAATLDDAQRHADAGRLDDAKTLALAFVERHGPHADAFYLLGLIADARGLIADARDSYRKALYLAPAHYEALTHLAALLDMTGDGAGAQQLMWRAERAKPRARLST